MNFKCSQCDRVAEADPSWVVDVVVSLEDVDDAEAERRTANGGVCLTYEEFQAVSENALMGLGITPEQRDALLRGEKIDGAACICPACQATFEVDDG